MKNTPDFSKLNIDPCLRFRSRLTEFNDASSLWDPGAVEEGSDLPRFYIHNQYPDGRPFNPEDHRSMMANRQSLYLLLWIAGHQFSAPDPGGEVPISPPPDLDPQQVLSAQTDLHRRGYIRVREYDGGCLYQLTGLLPLYDYPADPSRGHVCVQLNQRFWSSFTPKAYFLGLVLWFGLSSRVSNNILFAEFAVSSVPGIPKNKVVTHLEKLEHANVVKTLDRNESQFVDCRPRRASTPGRRGVRRGKVVAISDTPLTCAFESPFPDLKLRDPGLRYVYRGPHHPPLEMRARKGTRFECRGNRKVESIKLPKVKPDLGETEEPYVFNKPTYSHWDFMHRSLFESLNRGRTRDRWW